MDCVICKNGTTQEGFTAVTLQNNKTIVVIKDVPAQICDNCGHYYLSDIITKEVLALAQESMSKGIEIEVIRLKAAS
jgi:YgiT-type zinc finger domain-containing protein